MYTSSRGGAARAPMPRAASPVSTASNGGGGAGFATAADLAAITAAMEEEKEEKEVLYRDMAIGLRLPAGGTPAEPAFWGGGSTRSRSMDDAAAAVSAADLADLADITAAIGFTELDRRAAEHQRRGGVGAAIAFSTPWKCYSCTFVNTDCTRCNMCDTIKPPDCAISDSGPTAFGSSAAFHCMDMEDALAAVAAASGSSAASRRTALKKNVSFAEVPEAEWMKNSACKLCHKGFTLFHRRHHCRLCGGSVCDDCSSSHMRMGKKKRCCDDCSEF